MVKASVQGVAVLDGASFLLEHVQAGRLSPSAHDALLTAWTAQDWPIVHLGPGLDTLNTEQLALAFANNELLSLGLKQSYLAQLGKIVTIEGLEHLIPALTAADVRNIPTTRNK